jgi:outer membrane protein TolC
MARSAERLSSLYKTAIVPQATLALESAISAYEVGSVDFLTLINAATLLLDYELEYYEQLSAYQQALARIEPIVGKELIR